MSYYKRRSRRGRAKNGFGSAVTDTVGIANAFGPKGTLIAGLAGFTIFYFVLPWAMTAWAGYNNAKMSGQHAALFGKLIDDIFIRRFIHPAEWAGIAILVACILLACWKAFTRTDLNRRNEHQLSALAKLLARFLD